MDREGRGSSFSNILGRLHIANPDDSAKQNNKQSPKGSQQASRSMSADAGMDTPSPKLDFAVETTGRPMSYMDFDPDTYTPSSNVLEQKLVNRMPMSAKEHSDSLRAMQAAQRQIPRKQLSGSSRDPVHRNSTATPMTYQGQQQAQFPQHHMMPNQPQQQHQQRPPQFDPRMAFPPDRQTPASRNGAPYRSGESRRELHHVASRDFPNRDNFTRNGQGLPGTKGPNVVTPIEGRSRAASNQELRQPIVDAIQARPPNLSYPGPPGARNGRSEYIMPASSEEWKEKGAAITTQRTTDASGRTVTKSVRKGVQDFSFGETLGEGSYSTVVLARDKMTKREYAIKILDKRHIIREKKVKYVNIEKDTLNRLTDHPGIVKLYYTFQDERQLYYVLDVASGGELLTVLKRMGTFDEECTRFYTAQILDAIGYIHSRGVIHRDIKPENILLDDKMHIKITDFGTAKLFPIPSNTPDMAQKDPSDDHGPLMREENGAKSFVGTAEYVSPELLNDKSAGKASDLWAFGCIVYQLLAGRPPFKDKNEYLTFRKILHLDYSFPTGFPPVAKDLVERLLVIDPDRRLTLDNIMNHEFFRGVVWGKGLWQCRPPPLRSYVPPPAPPIRFNSSSSELPQPSQSSSNIPVTTSNASHSVHSAHLVNDSMAHKPQARPPPRIITDLPPPSQLDIEWSPVLGKENERILRMAVLAVSMTGSSSPTSKNPEGGKFSRLFGMNSNNKRRNRMVMVTSLGRMIVANSEDEKKVKFDVDLLDPSCSWAKTQDTKGFTYWFVQINDKQYTFEEPKVSSSDKAATVTAAEEWFESLEQARDIGMSDPMRMASSMSVLSLNEGKTPSRSTSNLKPMPSMGRIDSFENGGSRNVLHSHREPPGSAGQMLDESKGFKRFSKRQSKGGGLAAVF